MENCNPAEVKSAPNVAELLEHCRLQAEANNDLLIDILTQIQGPREKEEEVKKAYVTYTLENGIDDLFEHLLAAHGMLQGLHSSLKRNLGSTQLFNSCLSF